MHKIYHRYHLVTPSPWPFLSAFAALNLTLGAVAYMHQYERGGLLLTLGFLSVFIIMAYWWRDVIREATFQGKHTNKVQRGLRLGFVLFVFSEVMFFFGFFWAFFHSSLAPSIEIGGIWPPSNIIAPNPWGIPLLNTVILLLSGVSITYTHQFLVLGRASLVVEGFIYTIVAALVFLIAQLKEFIEAPFDISDGIFGSTFFMLTGFHGAHVIVGTIFIIVCFIRFLKRHFYRNHHVGFEAAVWYWHFVDVVWLFLFVCVYYWGSLTPNEIAETVMPVESTKATSVEPAKWGRFNEIKTDLDWNDILGTTNRKEIKELAKEFKQENPGVKSNVKLSKKNIPWL